LIWHAPAWYAADALFEAAFNLLNRSVVRIGTR
jgi:hypothetical protein